MVKRRKYRVTVWRADDVENSAIYYNREAAMRVLVAAVRRGARFVSISQWR